MHAVVSCGVPRIVKEGSSNFTGTTFGETATYSCNNGYILSGSAEIICQADANWDAEPECLLAGEFMAFQHVYYIMCRFFMWFSSCYPQRISW